LPKNQNGRCHFPINSIRYNSPQKKKGQNIIAALYVALPTAQCKTNPQKQKQKSTATQKVKHGIYRKSQTPNPAHHFLKGIQTAAQKPRHPALISVALSVMVKCRGEQVVVPRPTSRNLLANRTPAAALRVLALLSM
jgi:hypothetical protein